MQSTAVWLTAQKRMSMGNDRNADRMAGSANGQADLNGSGHRSLLSRVWMSLFGFMMPSRFRDSAGKHDQTPGYLNGNTGVSRNVR
jgi:hypothetical protein